MKRTIFIVFALALALTACSDMPEFIVSEVIPVIPAINDGEQIELAFAPEPEESDITAPEDLAPEIVPVPEATPEPAEMPPIEINSSRNIDPARPMIALTFDDGPVGHTVQIIELLELYDVPATFFFIGEQVGWWDSLARRIIAQGSEIGAHSWGHADYTTLSADELKRDLQRTNAAIETAVGVSPVLFRPPYGRYNDEVQFVTRELGMAIVNWSIDPSDWELRDAADIYLEVMTTVHDRGILLLHDIYAETVAAVAMIIPALIEQGYQIVTVSELLYYSDIALEAGVVYWQG